MHIATLLYNLSKKINNKIEESSKELLLRNKKSLEESFLSKFDLIIRIKVVIIKNDIFQKIVYSKKFEKRKISTNIVRKKDIKLKLEDCCLLNNLFYIKNRIYVFNNQELRTHIIKNIYNTLFENYAKRFSIYKRVSRHYYWLKITNTIAQYVRNYYTCKRTKIYRENKQDLLKLLLISNCYWQDIMIDFITLLFVCKRYNKNYQYIIIVVDFLSKKKRFIALNSLFVETIV